MNGRHLVLGSVLLAVSILIPVDCASPGGGAPLFTSPITTPPITATLVSPIITPPASTTRVAPPIVPTNDVAFTFDFGGPAAPNKPIPLTITVSSKVDLPGVQVAFIVLGPLLDRNDSPRPLGDLKANQPKQITTTLVLPSEAEYFVKVHIFTPQGFHDSDSKRVIVANEGIVINPTSAYGPGEPAPAAQTGPRVTPLPTGLP